MPKQIIKKELPKPEKLNSGLGIIAMLMSICLSSLLILVVQNTSDDKEPTLLGLGTFSAYTLFTLVCLAHLIQGIVAFKKLESYASLFSSMLTGVSVFGLLVNIQFMLAMLFTSLGKDGMVKKLVGEGGMTDFISTQTSAWNLMLAGICTAFAAGMIGTIRLLKKR